MKKMSVFLLIVTIFIGFKFGYPIDEKLLSIEQQKVITDWETDFKTIISYISGLRNLYEEKENDTDLKKAYKAELREKEYKKESARIKKVYYNTEVKFNSLTVANVVSEVKFTKEGNKKLNEVKSAIKNNSLYAQYLVNQFEQNRYKYEVETGNYEIHFTLPLPSEFKDHNSVIRRYDDVDKYPDTETPIIDEISVIYIIKSKIKAMEYAKDSIHAVTGKIIEIKHGFGFGKEYVIFRLTE